jgi:tRNA(Ile)-lysidine synthase
MIPIFDPSNLDQTYFRNRLRYDLIPYLERYNPNIKEIIHHTADILREDHEILSKAIDTAWRECLFTEGPEYLALRIDCLQKLQTGLQRHIFRRAIAHHSPDLRDIELETIDRILAFIDEPTKTFQRDLVAGLRLSIEDDLLWIARWESNLPETGWPTLPEISQLTLTVPGTISLGNGWELSAEILIGSEESKAQAFNNHDLYQAWLDHRALSSTLQIRTRRPGDRFQPQGLDGHSIKLTDFMINLKMNRRARERWPLVCSEGTIVWIPGHRIHHAYRVTNQTEQILYLKLSIQ